MLIGMIVRRSLGAVVTFVLASVVVFVITFALPGDPARTIAGRRQPSAGTLSAIRERYHLEEPLPRQYVRWMSGLLRGDLGDSYVARRPVSDVLLEAIPTTIVLLTVTIVIEVVVGVIVGTTTGGRWGSALDHGVLVACTLALAVPTFVAGIIAQDLLGVRWKVMPVSGVDDGLRSFILPATVLALPGLAVAIRLMRSETLSNRSAPHVRTARAKGLAEATVTRRHVVRNSLGPFLAFVGLELGVLAGGSIVVERVFNLPGVGGALSRAISLRDNTLILGFTMALIAVYLLIDLVVDVAALMLDPRLAFDEL